MFNNKNASSEIADLMESHLITHAVEKKEEHINKFAKALDYLNSVAEIFDELGLLREAEATTTFLEALAKKKAKKKPSKSKTKTKARKSDQPTKGLTSKKMVSNLEEKGWVFNADDDFSFADDEYHEDNCDCSMCDDDDSNYSFDMEDDDNYADEDFEDEVDMSGFETLPSTPVAKRNRDYPTLPSTPVAKRHQANLEEDEEFGKFDFDPSEFPTIGDSPQGLKKEYADLMRRVREKEDASNDPYRRGGDADKMDDFGFEYHSKR